ncbi:unnamed protein product [Phyllotreta striolata]|uniref:Uncharacterized protein n=1 Tax=Phyllotreta striolata TaxID=444603 RepID=A0A9N9TWB5_PHYSR|nr:unnamed protein product [Phyllotreta striolata]
MHLYRHISVLLCFSLLTIETKRPEREIIERAKRHLLQREKEYLKSQPLSENLRKFIEKFKRKARKTRSAGDASSTSTASTTISSYSSSTSSSTKFVNQSESSASTTQSLNDSSTCTAGDYDKIETDDYELDQEETTTQRKELLGKVMKDVQELIRYENAAKTSEGDASLCNITGDFDSFAGGMQIRFYSRLHPNNPTVKIVPQDPPTNGFLAEGTWNATSMVPFRHSSLVAITAVSNKGKKIANFLGECRICDGAESITGHWMIRRRSKNCKDREEANSFVSDVLRRNNARTWRKQHLNQVSTTDNVDLSN